MSSELGPQPVEREPAKKTLSEARLRQLADARAQKRRRKEEQGEAPAPAETEREEQGGMNEAHSAGKAKLAPVPARGNALRSPLLSSPRGKKDKERELEMERLRREVLEKELALVRLQGRLKEEGEAHSAGQAKPAPVPTRAQRAPTAPPKQSEERAQPARGDAGRSPSFIF
jgi:hypothetical protein